MNEQHMMEEQGIVFSDYLWSLLEQWRGMIAVGLLFAILLAGAKYALNLRALRISQTEEAQQAEAAEILYKGEKNVVRVLTTYQDWQDQKTFYEENPLMRIDPASEERFVMRFYLSAADPEKTDLNTLVGCYALFTSDENFQETVAPLFEEDIKPIYLRELFTCSIINNSSINMSGGRGFTVVVILPPREGEYDYVKIAGTMTEYMEKKRDTLSRTFGDFTVSLISANSVTISYPGRSTAQTTQYNKVLSGESKFNTQYSALTASEKASADRLVSEGNVKEWLRKNHFYKTEEESQDKEQEQSTKSGAKAVRIPVKYAAVGFVIGLLAFAGLLFFQFIFSRRLRDEDEIRHITGLRSFGGIYSYPYSSGWKRFAHDKRIYAIRHRASGKPAIGGKKIARNVAARVSHMDVSPVSMIVLGNASDWARSIVERQADILKEEKVEVREIFAEKGVSSIEEKDYTQMGAALIVLLSDVTTPGMVADLLTRLQEYQIPVLGTEFLEGA